MDAYHSLIIVITAIRGQQEKKYYEQSADAILNSHYTVVCLVTWPGIGSEAGGDLVLIQTSLFFAFYMKIMLFLC